MMALNLALLILMFGLTRLHTWAISQPMCSPSLSQSVQIMSSSACRASFCRFLSIPRASFDCREGFKSITRNDKNDWSIKPSSPADGPRRAPAKHRSLFHYLRVVQFQHSHH